FAFCPTVRPPIYVLSLHDALPILPRGPNVGTVERALYEATPLHSLAALVAVPLCAAMYTLVAYALLSLLRRRGAKGANETADTRSEEHTSELHSRFDIVCRLLLDK